MKEAQVVLPPEEWLFGTTSLCFAWVTVILGMHALDSGRAAIKQGVVSPRKFLIGAAIAAIGTLGFTAAWGTMGILYALPFSIGLSLSLFHPIVATGFLLANTMLRPWEVVSIPSMAVIPKLAGAVCAFSWLYHGLRRKNLTILFTRPVRHFAGLALWFFISALASGDADAGLSEFNGSFLIAAIIFVMIVNIPKTPEDIRVLTKTIAVSVWGVIGVAILVTLANPEFKAGGVRLVSLGLLGNSNDLGAVIVLAFPMAALPFFKSASGARYAKGRGDKILAWICLPLFGVGLWLAESRGSILGLAAGLWAYSVARSKNAQRSFLKGLLVLPFALLAVSILSALRSSADVNGSTESRLGYVIAGLKMAIHHPLLGVGLGNYPKFFESFAPNMTYEWGERTAHNSWILALAENGFPAFLFLLGLFVYTLREAWRIRQQHPELLASLIGYGLAMSFLSHTYTIFPYMLFALVLAASQVKRREVIGSKDLVVRQDRKFA